MIGLFVTGTSTNIGKTVVSAALFHRYRHVTPLRYWKPVQTGVPEDDDTAAVNDLCACEHDEVYRQGVRLPRPLSPHLSAELCGAHIAVSEIAHLAQSPSNRSWIVEGAGGVLVPLNNKEFMTDLIAALGLPVVIATSSQVGTINHTLLTLEALRNRSIVIAGVILNGDLNPENRRAIEKFGQVAVLGEMPRFSPLSAAGLADWSTTELDPESRLLPFLQNPK